MTHGLTPPHADNAPPPERLPRTHSDVVLIVDDVPDNLAVLHDALDESGYTVLVALHGEAALHSAVQARPDIVLLDAMMPGMDGFEVARRLQADPRTAAIPIIFMTGLTDTEHLVAAFSAGAVDYVTKPVRTAEVLARMNGHLQSVRRAREQMQWQHTQTGQARNALDAFGYATLTVRVGDGRLLWQTALARQLLQRYFGEHAGHDPRAPAAVHAWLQRSVQALSATPLEITQGLHKLVLELHRDTGDSEAHAEGADPHALGDPTQWMVVLREQSIESEPDSLARLFALTPREGQVLYWLAQGKTNRDIGDILGSSPATVKKHLERIYVKLGVETRTGATGAALSRLSARHFPRT